MGRQKIIDGIGNDVVNRLSETALSDANNDSWLLLVVNSYNMMFVVY